MRGLIPIFQVPLGFDFDFFDITSNQLYASDNSLGGFTTLNQDEEHLYMLVQFYASLIDRGYAQDSALSPIYYKTEGLEGERVFTLEYDSAGLFYGLEDTNSIILDYINLQVRLYEGSGDIEFHIGPYSITEDPEIIFDPYPGPIIGITADVNNIFGGDFGELILLSGDPLNPTVVTDSIANLTWPIPENTVYRFSKMGTSDGDHLSDSKQPLLFPNPTSGVIHLDGNISKDVIYPIIVMDVLGKPVSLWNTEAEISATDLAAGSYFVIVHAENKVVTEKLVVLSE